MAEKEGLRGQVQCIYFDPPYGIKFNSNWQVSTRSRDVKDGKIDQISREPEQVKAFRDTWKDGINSYLTTKCAKCPAGTNSCTDGGSNHVRSTSHARKVLLIHDSESHPVPRRLANSRTGC